MYNIATGSYIGNGLDNRNITGIGFQPDFIFIKRADIVAVWLKSSTHSGVQSQAVDSVNSNVAIKSFISDGFQLGTSTNVNSDTKTYRWIAFKSDGITMKVLSYTGDGLDNHAISGVGFQPDFVFIKRDDNVSIAEFSSTSIKVLSALRSYSMFDTSSTDIIKSFISNGFTLGTSSRSNANGSLYHAICFKRTNGAFQDGTFIGNGLDNRNITGIGFQPKYLWVKGDIVNNGRHRSNVIVGDISMNFGNQPDDPNTIQEIQSNGFQIGTNDAVNQNTKDFAWVAWAQGSSTQIFRSLLGVG